MQIFKTMEKSEFHVLIKHCFLMWKNTVQAKQWLDKCYLDSAPSEATVKRWYADFKCGRTDTNDDECSGHPNSAISLENTKKPHKLVLANCKLKLGEMAEELKISEGNVFTFLREHLSMRKLFSKWLLHLLAVNQKQQCINDSEHCLQLFQCNKKEFCINLWQWMKHESTTSLLSQISSQFSRQQQVKAIQWPKMQTSAGKVLASVFWDAQGILFIKKRPLMKKKKVLFHQDNAPCYKLIATMVKLHELHFKLLPHPPYSPDLAPSNYWLFADLKGILQGKRFGSNEEVILETEAYFEAKDKFFYKKGIELLEKHWNQCITLEGDYVEE